MLLLIIGIIILVIGIISAIICEKMYDYSDILEIITVPCVVLGLIFTFLFGGLTLGYSLSENTHKIDFMLNYNEIKKESQIAIDKYDSLAIQNLNSEIRELNVEIEHNKALTDNIWIGSFYYDFYKDVEPLPLIKSNK